MNESIKNCLAIVSAMALCLCLDPRGLRADVVHLKNGRSMEGMVLEETPERVLLQLPFGEIGLARASVSRIERGESPLGQYLERRRGLELRTGGAEEWLDLALWAEGQGLDHSAREAVFVAARLDPGLPGLASPMTALGYEYEQNLAVWLPHDALMRRRGFVFSDGRWLSPDQAATLSRARAAEDARHLERQRQDRMARAVEMMVLAQLAQAEENRRAREETRVYTHGIPLWGGYPVVVPPGYSPRPSLRPTPHHPRHNGRTGNTHRGSRRSHRQGIVDRPPGSLIPVTPAASHHGGIQKASGSK